MTHPRASALDKGPFARAIAVLTLISSVVTSPAPTQAATPLPTIQWDPATLRLIQQGGDYGRMARLPDGTVACAYDHDRKMYLRLSPDGGSTFPTPPILVASDPDCWLTNASLLPLKDGTLLYFWNARPLAAMRYQHHPAPPDQLTRPFLIQMSRSTDAGHTWSAPQTLYTAGPTFQDGCWEPAALQLPTGEIHVYFSNEAPYTTTDEQEISLLRSTDNGQSWSPAQRVSFRPNHRDGMPNPLLLAGNRGIAVAIEDNGLSGNAFKPSIFSTTLPDNWHSPSDRHAALATPLDPAWYAGAPYLAQLPNAGPTLLSFQESPDGRLEDCRMAVCVGTPDATGFTNKTYPLPNPTQGNQAWNSLFVKDASTVTAILTATVNDTRGIYAIDGHPWTPRTSTNATATFTNNELSLDAPPHTRAHLERPAPATDNITLSSQINHWGAIYLVWDKDNWCGVGTVSPTPFGRIYSIDSRAGQTTQVDHRGIDFGLPHLLRVQLGSDHIAFQYKLGPDWVTLRSIPRPPSYSGPPKLIAAGKPYLAGDKPFGSTDEQPSADPAKGTLSHLTITSTPPADLSLPANPSPTDPVAALLTRDDNDPTFDELARLYPPMKSPREIVGVPFHPLDIGVDRLGRLDVSPWGPPVAWFDFDGQSLAGPNVDQSAYATWDRSAAALTPTEQPGRITRRLQDGSLPILTLSNDTGSITVFGYSENFSPDKDLYAYVRLSSHTAKTANLFWAKGGKHSFPLAAGSDGQACFRFKYPDPSTVTPISPEEFESKRIKVTRFWTDRLSPSAIFDLPDPRVMAAYRAWLVYSMLNTDTVNGHLEPHDGAGFYEEMFGNSVSLHTMALDQYGQHDEAARALDTQIHFQQPDGLYTQACGLVDPGGFLAGLAQHYRMTGDKDWLRRISPALIRQCHWLLAQRASTPKDGPLRGLIKFRPYNDYPAPTYNYLGNAWCAQGLALAASVLKDINAPEADAFAKEAAAYRQDILDSMKASAFQHDGQTLLPMEPDTHRLLQLGNHRGGDYYGLVASPLLAVGLIPPDDERATWIVDALEKRHGLVAGVCEFEDGIDHAYTYGYLLNSLQRHQPRKTLLGFYSFLAFGMTRDTYAPVEVSMARTGENQYTLPHLYSCTEQLRLLRTLLIREDHDTLHLGEGIPRAWLAPGQHVAVTNAPTEFGPLTFRLDPLPDGATRITLTPPTRHPPKEIHITLRDPSARTITTVSLQGTPPADVQPKGDTIIIRRPHGPMTLLARFERTSHQQN